ncbi:MAG: sigma-70 family RNA polymerase sigma factor [Allosphingosinicella sp.]|uniref:sigma-70 family RNA polymerase sigma factor n=1 Tax=Allosphingosinicella sp. TaxID=2823234 RepID=UPI003924B5F4
MDQLSPSTAAADRKSLAEAIGRVAEGSQAALEEVYARTRAKLFGVCLRILRDRGEAEDALQDVYVSLWRRAGSFDPDRASPISWLAALARNRAIDRFRASGRVRAAAPIEAALERPDGSPDALTRLESREEGTRLFGCVEELEERQASAIRAAFFDGYSYSELAERIGVPLGTMKSWVRRGLLRLRECLER